ncbi:MAG: outer membrane lipoprotein-sorting protein [Deltaproteobacteria bacterium]|nr:outer membrane lipoprotein-sorting protein [Deltaproteobacteria bacterium]MBW2360535.1 outer membrane lipoprotein-sorting protein [Deltaproteobacteria bacterium]
MFNQTLGRLTIVLMTGFAQASLSVAAELTTAEEIDACYESNFPDSTAVQTVTLSAKDRIGAVTTSRATLYWKKFDDGLSKVMMRFEKPADLRGAGLLMIEKKKRNDLFMYLPELRRVKRISKHMSSGSMFGTDFSYEEFERIQGMKLDGVSERLEDDEIGGREMYVTSATPAAEEESSYERIKTWIDKQTCVALRTEFYERGDQPRKIMTAPYERVSREADVWVAREIVMHDRRDETDTTLRVEELEIGLEVPRKLFSQKELDQGGR